MHSFIIIHPKNPDPKQVKEGNVKRPSVYDLMGGSEWNNNGRNIIVVHKNSKENYEPYTINIDKVKPKHYGTIGAVSLHLDWAKQRFYKFDEVYSRKKYAYGEVEQVNDNIEPLIHNADEIF